VRISGSLEAAAGEHDHLGAELGRFAFVPRAHARYALAVVDERADARLVEHFYARFPGRRVQVLHEARAAAVDLDRHVAEVHALAVHHARLAAVVQNEARPLGPEPRHDFEALVDQDLGEIGIGAVARQAIEDVEVFLARVGAEIAIGFFSGLMSVTRRRSSAEP